MSKIQNTFSCLIIFLFLFCLQLNAQVATPAYLEEAPQPYSNQRWERVAYRFALIRPFIGQETYKLSLEGVDGKLEWQPNSGLVLGVDLDLNRWGYFGFAIPLPASDKETKGSTSQYDFRILQIHHEWALEFDLQNYKGFYTELDNQKFLKKPSLTMTNIGARLLYFFSPEKFSYSALLKQTERSLRSGGSWVLGANVGWSEFTDPQGVIPLFAAPVFGEYWSLSRTANYYLIPKGGYAYNFVPYHKFFIGGMFLIGVGAQQTIQKFRVATKKSTSRLIYGTDVQFVASMGYTGDHYLSSLSFDYDALSFSRETANLSTDLYSFHFNFGYRF